MSTKVKLFVSMSGTRDGQPWPPAGSVVELPDDEAKLFLDQQLAYDHDAEGNPLDFEGEKVHTFKTRDDVDVEEAVAAAVIEAKAKAAREAAAERIEEAVAKALGTETATAPSSSRGKS